LSRIDASCWALVVLLFSPLIPSGALAGGRRVPAKTPDLVASRMVVVQVGQSSMVHLPSKPNRLTIDDPTIASYAVLPRAVLRIVGKQAGDTHIRGSDAARRRIAIAVKVLPGAAPTRHQAPRRSVGGQP
jgi:Flp pilus assembly secretin CpaC